MRTFEERECEACGAFYVPTRVNQKYCQDCIAHGGIDVRRQYDRNVKRSKRYERAHSLPKLYDHVCRICHEPFKSTGASVPYCTSCYRMKQKELLKCRYCGRLLSEAYAGRGEKIPDEELMKNIHFCSNECEERYQTEMSPTGTCANCGKTLSKKNTKFCCRDCYLEHVKIHRKRNYPHAAEKFQPKS